MNRRLIGLLVGAPMTVLMVLMMMGIASAQPVDDCSTDGIDNDGDLVTDEPGETCPDTTKPRIRPKSPLPGSNSADLTPTIKARVSDDATELDATDIELFLDNNPVTSFSYNPDTDLLKYTPQSDLSLGEHTMKVVATDEAGNRKVKRWSFTVVGDCSTDLLDNDSDGLTDEPGEPCLAPA